MELNERIALARKQAGLSQEQLGERLGVSRQAVSKWESGQTNPDVAYIIGMCRLLGVSSDWLLMGEESEQEAVHARCPGCQSIVTGLDKYCPNCGRSLKVSRSDGYTLLLKPTGSAFTLDTELRKLSMTKWFSPSSPLSSELSPQEAAQLVEDAPLILDRGLRPETIQMVLDRVLCPSQFVIYRDDDGDTIEELLTREPVPANHLVPYTPPMSFGSVVLAVLVGIIGAIVLLAFL